MNKSIQVNHSKRTAFTLVELLAVITVLGILALILTPVISSIIDESKKNAGVISTEDVIKATKVYYMNALNNSITKTTIDGQTNILSRLNLTSNVPDTGIIYVTKNGDISLALVYGNYCYTKGFTNDDILVSDYSNTCEVLPYSE